MEELEFCVGEPPATESESTTAGTSSTEPTRIVRAEGRILLEDEFGGILFETTDGQQYIVEPDQIISRRENDRPFHPDSAEEITKKVLAELPDGFRTLQTPHYTLIYQTPVEHARWCGGILEQLYRTFNTFWSVRSVLLTDPEFPLVVVIFSDRKQYMQKTRDELGEASASIVSFYSMNTNQIMTFDAAGTQAYADRYGRLTTKQIAMIPMADENVRNLVHEATHQLMFNRGLAHRFYDVPRWYAEGMACYFEVPDPTSARGWGRLGEPNPIRTRRFAAMIADGRDGSADVLRSDKAFLMTDTALDAYAEAYSIFFRITKMQSGELKRYAATTAGKRDEASMLADADPETRLADFEAAFGDIDTFRLATRRYWLRLFTK